MPLTPLQLQQIQRAEAWATPVQLEEYRQNFEQMNSMEGSVAPRVPPTGNLEPVGPIPGEVETIGGPRPMMPIVPEPAQVLTEQSRAYRRRFEEQRGEFASAADRAEAARQATRDITARGMTPRGVPVAPEAVARPIEDLSGFEALTEAFKRQELGEAPGDEEERGFVDRVFTSTEAVPGKLVESRTRQALRVLGGINRIVMQPLVEWLTYEVDEEGKPKDTSDLAYQIEQAMPDFMRERPGVIGAPWLPRAFQARTTDDSEFVVAESSDWMRDVALSIANSSSLMNDFNSLVNYRKYWEESNFPGAKYVPSAMGFALELAIPIVPGLGPGAKVSQKVLDTAAGGARAANLSTAAKLLDNASHPVREARLRRAINVVDREAKGLGAEPNAWKADTDSYGVQDTFATRVADDVVRPIQLRKELEALGDELGDLPPGFIARHIGSPVVRRAVAKAAKAEDVIDGRKLLDELVTWEKGMDTALEAGKLSRSMRVALGIAREASETLTPITVRISENMEMLGKQGIRGTTAEKEARVLTAKQAVQEIIANDIPNDFIILTPTTVISRRARDEIADGMNRELRETLEGVQVTSGTQTGTQFLRRDAVATALRDALGTAKIEASSKWSAVLKGLAKGKAFDEKVVRDISEEVMRGIAKRLIAESPNLRASELVDFVRSGRALRLASKATKLQGMRQVGELIQDVVPADFANKVALSLPRAMSKYISDYFPAFMREETAGGSARLTDWLRRMEGELQQNVNNFKTEMVQTIKGAKTPEEGLQKMIDQTIKDSAKKGRKGGEQTQANLAWTNVLEKFFGPTFKADDFGVQGVIGRFPDTMKLTPDNLMKAVAELRRLNPDLETLGLRTGTVLEGGLASDNFAGALLAWMVEQRAVRVVARNYDDLLAKNPEIALIPQNLATVSPSVSRNELAALFDQMGLELGKDATEFLVDAVNEVVRTIAKRMSDEDRFNLVELLISYKVAKADPYAKLPDVSSLPRAVGQLLNKKTLDDFTRLLSKAKGLEGVSDENFATVVDAATKMLINIVTRNPDDLIRAHLISGGMLTNSGPQAVHDITMRLLSMPGREKILTYYGADVADLVTRLQAAAKNGSLQRNLERLQRSPDGDWAWRSLGALWDLGRRWTIGGLLGGFPLPNTRFLGLNALTAPLIVATTLGSRAALNSIGFSKTNRLYNWAAVNVLAKGDEVLFTRNGIKWTRDMVEKAIERNNVKYSQVGFEFSEVVLSDIVRMLGVDSKMRAVGNPRTIMRWLDPGNKNLWNNFAEKTDNYFRQNVFVSALAEGKSEIEAAEMARRALLDYGSLPKSEREIFARYIYFWAFQRLMATEAATALITRPSTLRRMAAAQRDSHKEAGTWAIAPDYQLVRLWGRMSETYDHNMKTGVYGPDNPAMQGFLDFVSVMMVVPNVMGASPEDDPVGSAMDSISERAYNPLFDAVLEIKQAGFEKGRSGYVPMNQVAFMKQMGVWDYFTSAFDVVGVSDPKEQRRGDPTQHGYQYRFASPGAYKKYIGSMAILTGMALRRNIDDYSKVAIAAGIYPEGMEPKRMSDGKWYMVAANMQTAMKLPDKVAIRDKHLRGMERDLRNMATR